MDQSVECYEHSTVQVQTDLFLQAWNATPGAHFPIYIGSTVEIGLPPCSEVPTPSATVETLRKALGGIVNHTLSDIYHGHVKNMSRSSTFITPCNVGESPSSSYSCVPVVDFGTGRKEPAPANHPSSGRSSSNGEASSRYQTRTAPSMYCMLFWPKDKSPKDV